MTSHFGVVWTRKSIFCFFGYDSISLIAQNSINVQFPWNFRMNCDWNNFNLLFILHPKIVLFSVFIFFKLSIWLWISSFFVAISQLSFSSNLDFICSMFESNLPGQRRLALFVERSFSFFLFLRDSNDLPPRHWGELKLKKFDKIRV